MSTLSIYDVQYFLFNRTIQMALEMSDRLSWKLGCISFYFFWNRSIIYYHSIFTYLKQCSIITTSIYSHVEFKKWINISYMHRYIIWHHKHQNLLSILFLITNFIFQLIHWPWKLWLASQLILRTYGNIWYKTLKRFAHHQYYSKYGVLLKLWLQSKFTEFRERVPTLDS